jgi:hypothetical protein
MCPSSVSQRPHLAIAYANHLQTISRLGGTVPLFLWSSPGTETSTFLIQDFIPEATSRGWLPIYVDLTRHTATRTTDLVAAAIEAAFQSEWKCIPKVPSIPSWLKHDAAQAAMIDRTHAGVPGNINLNIAFQGLRMLTGKSMVVITDEAPVLLEDPFGNSMLAILKTMAQSLNRGEDVAKFMLLFTGSDHVKLSHMVTDTMQPFYGCSITSFSC